MELIPVKASAWLSDTTFSPEEKALLQSQGILVVNDILLPVFDADYDILLLFGGRGGGKSEAVADHLLRDCMRSEYFKCYYGRKVYDTLRGSSFATIIYCIKKNNLVNEFHYSEAENSSMVITHKATGNKFIPFGSDKADKLKSIKDPTHIWGEEFDQFAFADFKELYPTLRTLRGANRFIATFNTHGVLPSHWILKLFFPDQYEGADRSDIEGSTLLEGRRIEKVFVNYTDNYFIDQKAYRQNLWIAAAGSYSIFEGIANGAWGVQPNDSPWAYAYDKTKHVGSCQRNWQEPIYLSWDFNRNPMCCNVIQHYGGGVYVLEVIKQQKAGVDGVCEYIKTMYARGLFIVTGDYSGMTESSLFKEQITHYTQIKKYLNLSDGQIKVKPNPKLKDNSTLVNTILAFYNVTIDKDKAKPLIFDMENVKRLADGTIEKTDRNDPAQQSDALDGFRYFCNMFLPNFTGHVSNQSEKDYYLSEGKNKMIESAKDLFNRGFLDDAQKILDDIMRLDAAYK